jgi:hypothetical protein
MTIDPPSFVRMVEARKTGQGQFVVMGANAELGWWGAMDGFPAKPVQKIDVSRDRNKSSIYLTSTVDDGLRTLSGGQYSIQVEGYLAVDQSAAPAVVVEAAHAVRDVFAVLGTVADAPVQLQVKLDGAVYCTLTVPTGMPTSAAADGMSIGPLAAGGRITLSVLSVGQTYPGADLTVLIRL